MKILLVDSDRDFLSSFQRLLELSGHEVETVFDGAQAVMRLPSERFDVVVLEQNIPRIDSREIIRLLNEEGVPVIVILENRIQSVILMDRVLASDYLSLPFFPNELMEAVEEAGAGTSPDSGDFDIGDDIRIDVSRNLLCGQLRVTNREIRVLRELSDNIPTAAKDADPYISSLNNKLIALNKKTRIRYIMNEGYRLVMNHE